MQKAYAIIPARFASTRLPGKPLSDILGKPMIQWVYERAASVRLLKEVWVATDDEKILKAVEGFGGKVMLTEAEHSSGTDRVAEAARKLKLTSDKHIIVNIQGDEPLISPKAIQQAILPLIKNQKIVMSTLSVQKKDKKELNDPNIVKVIIDKSGFAIYFSRLPIASSEDLWLKHIGLYVYRGSFLQHYTKLPKTDLEQYENLEQLRAIYHGFKIKVVITEYDSISVDTPEDLKLVRKCIK